MNLFRPATVMCPLCNEGKRGYGSGHRRVGERKFVGFQCGHEFTLFESLAKKAPSFFSILTTYTTWSWSSTVEVPVGMLHRIEIPFPKGQIPFAAFLTQFRPESGPQVGYVPRVIAFESEGILISTPADLNTQSDLLGTQMNLDVSVDCYGPNENRTWALLFFDALRDFSEHRYEIALTKLVTSLEIAFEISFEILMVKNKLPSKLIKQIQTDGRNWHSRISRFEYSVFTLLEPTELGCFTTAAKRFLNEVVKLRNGRVHQNDKGINHKEAVMAFGTCFPLLWAIERAYDHCRSA